MKLAFTSGAMKVMHWLRENGVTFALAATLLGVGLSSVDSLQSGMLSAARAQIGIVGAVVALSCLLPVTPRRIALGALAAYGVSVLGIVAAAIWWSGGGRVEHWLMWGAAPVSIAGMSLPFLSLPGDAHSHVSGPLALSRLCGVMTSLLFLAAVWIFA